jgi:CubicO group peptidase (beta-lactamase class C family)
MTFSVTKSYVSTVAGLAWDAGLIQDLNDKVADCVWDGTFDSEHNSKITWEHLLTQSSDWSGCLFGMYDWADRPPKEGTIDEWKNRTLFEPGTHFKYNDVRVNLLAYSLLQVWRKPLPIVLKDKVMDNIGASSTWRWYGYDNSFVNITYVPVGHGYMYLVAIIDLYSRFIVGWSLSNTMTASWCKECLETAILVHGKPEILNTDQGVNLHVHCLQSL